MISHVVVATCVVLGSVALAADKRMTIVEFSKDEEFPKDGSLATAMYEPTRIERPYHDRLSEDGQWTIQNTPAENANSEVKFEFHLSGHKGDFVGWSGIVRRISRDADGKGGTLLIENKYAGDATDSHIETVSIKGGGDFEAELTTIPEALIPLVLVRVYGTVAREKNGTPTIEADYIRVWHWFQFNFMDYGEDHGNPEWKKNVRVEPDDKVYHSGTWSDLSPKYYRDRLGPSQEQYGAIRRFHEARGPKTKPSSSPSARKK